MRHDDGLSNGARSSNLGRRWASSGPLRAAAATASALGLAVWVALAGGVAAGPAQAAFPGANGKIAFVSNRDGNFEIYVMNADGSAQTNLTNNAATDSGPAAWSPDGQKIAFTSNRDGNEEIYVMNADGTGVPDRLTNNPAQDTQPAWSPDGQKIAFTSTRDFDFEIYVMNADGTGTPLNRTNNPARDREPAWSPDGTKIAFTSGREVEPGEPKTDVFVMNPDGSNQVSRTSDRDTQAEDREPAWSPDGTKIAFSSTDGQDVGVPEGIWVMDASGSNKTNLTQDRTDFLPAWSPDGQRIAFASSRDGNEEIYVMNADGTGTPLNRTNNAASDFDPDWQPIPKKEPIIFVHGFLGSKIVCGGQELWPNLPLPRLRLMELERDGRTNRFCASAGPLEGQLVETALGSDVYKSTVDFLRDAAPDDFHLYAYDWRKNPEEAVAGLEALVDWVRPPDGQVVLMAHSMGGLVVRSYVEDAARAAKVSRAVTVGTPYWGSPKALFPLIYGVESPGLSALDAIFDNDELRAFARHLQGLFFLWPSARYGGWLSLEGRGVLSLNELFGYVDDHRGNSSLLATALGAHAARLDELRTNGVDYQTVVGSGIHTIGKVSIEQLFLLGRVPGGELVRTFSPEYVRVEWTNGDGTVPLKSARAATPAVRQHFVCGVSHVPLPGSSPLTARLRGFLLDGTAIEDDAFGVSGRLCDPQGFALSIFPLSGGLFASSATAQPSQAGALSLNQAESAGVLEALNTGTQIEAATSTRAPLTLSLPSKGAALRIARLTNGKRSGTRVYGPIKRGKITVQLDDGVTVRRNGKRVKPRRDDRRAPKTNVKVKPKGKRFVLSFRVIDASPTTTYVKIGKRVRRVKRKLVLKRAALRKGIVVQSVDAFGNVGRPKKIKRR